MIQIVLHKIIPPQTMGPDKEIETRIYSIPIDLFGPLEQAETGTIIYLRNGMGSVIVKETIEEIRDSMLSALLKVEDARSNRRIV